MATVKTSRAADVSPGGSRALLARHGIDIFPTLDADIVNGNVDFCTGDVRFVRPARTRRYTKDDDGVTEPLELIHGGLDKTEARLAKLDGKTATPSNRDFDGVWSRLKESDGRATALEGGQPSTPGGLGNTPQPNSSAAISPASLPKADGVDPITGSPTVGGFSKEKLAQGEIPAISHGEKYTRKPEPEETNALRRKAGLSTGEETEDGLINGVLGGVAALATAGIGGGIVGAAAGAATNDSATLAHARAVLSRGLLEKPSRAAVEAEAKRVVDRQAEYDYNKKAFGK